MGESVLHLTLVSMMEEWVAREYLSGDKGRILLDSPNSTSKMKPPIVYDFVPDLYVPEIDGDFLIIGEAKTSKDIENRHTEDQIKAFLRKCVEVPKSYFVVAVPWHRTRLVNSIIKHCKREIENSERVIVEVPAIFPG